MVIVLIIYIFLYRNREGLIKVITQLKSGDENNETNVSINEDSNSIDIPSETQVYIIFNCIIYLSI